MASIYKDIPIDAPAAAVWDCVRDFGAVHTRLAPGFVTDTRLDGDARIVTFASGRVLKENIVTVDDQARRLVWSVVGTQMTHHNGSIQIFSDGICAEGGACRLVWIADILPNDLEEYIAGMMRQGMDAMKRKLEAS